VGQRSHAGPGKKAATSPLAGKLFDETGDRLTRSHSPKNGKRLRYYISRRLVKDRSRKHPDVWRLPADQVEGLLAELVGRHLPRPDAAAAVTEGLTAAELTDVSKRLQEQGNVTEHLALIERVDLQPGSLTVRLDKAMFADRLRYVPEQINPPELTIGSPFQMLRRGVELKLQLGHPPAEIDRTLVQNIMKGCNWMALVIAGKTFSEIAEAEGVSKRRVQDVTNLALLAPDVLDGIATGEQPDGLTTDYLIKTRFPAVWSEQREQLATLCSSTSQTRTAGIANRDYGLKSARFVLLSASLLKTLSAKHPKTRDNCALTSQRQKTGKCVAGVVGLKEIRHTFNFNNLRDTWYENVAGFVAGFLGPRLTANRPSSPA
jgi:hypothetical protein